MGKVYLVGAGPGHVELVTLRALRLVREADCIIYDFLVPNQLLKQARKDAELIYVGKRARSHTYSQAKINELLVRKALEKDLVVRLKGGDPFIFGRGGEEALFLAEKGIDFEVVPGVTSAIAVPAYAGIPLTHREYASTVAFVTGREDEDRQVSKIDWYALAKIDTLVFLMGVGSLPFIKEGLLKGGKHSNTEACVIEWGTLPEQRVVQGRLEEIDKKAEEAGIRPPAILVVGEIVKLREKLCWFEKKPLFGKRIVVTRPEAQSEEMISLLEEEGAKVFSIPTIEIEPIDPNEELEKVLREIRSFFGIVFTSRNAVRLFFQTLLRLEMDVRELFGLKIFPIGPKTEQEIRRFGLRSEGLPASFTQEGIVELLKGFDLKQKKILLPRAEIAGKTVEAYIIREGGFPHVVPLYRTVTPKVRREIYEAVDAVCFTSPSTVRNFLSLYGREILQRAKVASIGPTTTRTLNGLGIEVHIEAQRQDVLGLVQAIKEYFANG